MIKRQKINSKEESMQSTATLRKGIPLYQSTQLLGKYKDAYLNYEQNSLKIAKILRVALEVRTFELLGLSTTMDLSFVTRHRQQRVA